VRRENNTESRVVFERSRGDPGLDWRGLVDVTVAGPLARQTARCPPCPLGGVSPKRTVRFGREPDRRTCERPCAARRVGHGGGTFVKRTHELHVLRPIKTSTSSRLNTTSLDR